MAEKCSLSNQHSNSTAIGPYNSWDRQPYLTNSGVDDGYTQAQKYGSSGSIVKKNDIITRNFMINGYNGYSDLTMISAQ